MSSIREQIRLAAKTRLQAIADLGGRVNGALFYPFDDDDVPCASIAYEGDEETVEGGIGALNMRAPLAVHVFTGGSDPQAAADALELQIHETLQTDYRMGGLAVEVLRSGTSFMPAENAPLFETVIRFSVTWRSNPIRLDQTA